MPVRLKDTDVVIVGLGAAGGVAALPLAQAGLDVIGLEAGTWLTRRDFAPDELRNNYRGWPQGVQKANQEIPTSRANASSPTATARHHSSDAERRRRHDAALLGAKLAVESVGLQSGERDDAALRRGADSDRIDGRRLAVRTRRARAVLRQGRVRNRRVRARLETSAAKSIRAATRSKGRGSAPIRCPRCAGPNSSRRWRRRRAASGGIRSPARPRSTRGRTRIGPPACITGSATAAAATSTRRTRRR